MKATRKDWTDLGLMLLLASLIWASGFAAGSIRLKDRPPAAKVHTHFPAGINLPPGTLVVEPGGGMMFIPDDLSVKVKP